MNMKFPFLLILGITITVAMNVDAYQYDSNEHENDHFDRKHTIRGHYGLVTTLSCVRTPFQQPLTPGIDADSKQLTIDAEAVETVGTATVKFRRDGTIKLKNGVLTEIIFNNTSAGDTPVFPPSEVNCEGNYELKSNSQLSLTMACNVKSPQPGVSIVLEPLAFKGYVSRNTETINLADIPGDIQTVSVVVNDTVVQKRERICVMTGSLTKLHKTKRGSF